LHNRGTKKPEPYNINSRPIEQKQPEQVEQKTSEPVKSKDTILHNQWNKNNRTYRKSLPEPIEQKAEQVNKNHQNHKQPKTPHLKCTHSGHQQTIHS
jgi:hypothetical protein